MDDNEIQFEYFKEAIVFFKEIQWLYNEPVTKVLSSGVLNLFPTDWLDSLQKLDNNELNNLVAKTKVQSHLPTSFINFVDCCKKLNKLPRWNKQETSLTLPSAFLKKLSIKKQHEIFHLAQLVHEKCLSQNITFIVDLGSGLGYISQLLNYLYGYQVLGLESNFQNVETAKKRQKTLFPESMSSVKFVCCNITANSAKSIETILMQEFVNTKNICLIGLHACGDLSAHMSKIYVDMINAQLLVLVSCCYHKLTIIDTQNSCESNQKNEYFNYFPLSETLNKAIKFTNLNIGEFFRRPFLRLACQETSDRWKNMSEEAHKEHSFYVLARAILELYGTKNELHLKKLVRKSTRKSQYSKFDIYLQDSMRRYSYTKQVADKIIDIPWNDEMKIEIITLWESNENQQKNIELYTALQLLLQNAAESVVLLDRLCYLKEHTFKTSIYPTMDRAMSPRSYAVISNK